MSDYLSGQITFAGLGSGTDFDAMIAQLKKVESIPKQRMELWRADWQTRYDAFGDLLTGIGKLKTTMDSMSTMNKILSRAAASSAPSVASAVATADASEGTTSLDVKQMATNAVLTNTTIFSGKDSTAGVTDPNGPDLQFFNYTYKGESHSVKVGKGSSVQLLVNQINKDAKARGIGVTASLISNGSGYTFQMQGNETGTKADLNIDSSTTLPAFAPSSMRSTTTYANAKAGIGQDFDITYNGVNKKYSQYLPNTLRDGNVYASGSEQLKNPLTFTRDSDGFSYTVPTTDNRTLRGTTSYTAGTDKLAENLSFTYGSGANTKTYAYSAADDKSLDDIVKEINDDPSNPGVTASLVKGSDGKFSVQVKANDAGSFSGTPAGLEEKKNTLDDAVKRINSENMKGGSSVKASLVAAEGGGYQMQLSGTDGNTVTGGSFAKVERTVGDLVKSINKDFSGVQASLITNADGTVSMDLQSNLVYDPANPTAPPTNGLTVTGFTPHNGSGSMTKRAAQDAIFTLNGLSMEYTSGSNSLAGVVEGLTINIVDKGKTNLTITTDTSKVKSQVETFVKEINTMLAQFQNVTKFDENKDTTDVNKTASLYTAQRGSVLTGNYGVQLLNTQFKSMLTGPAIGFDTSGSAAGDLFSSLSSIGIVMDASEGSATFGQLKILDRDKMEPNSPYTTLDEALEKDPKAVAEIFAGSGGVSDSPDIKFESSVAGKTKAGSYDVSYSVGADGKVGKVYIGGKEAQSDKGEYTVLEGPAAGMTISFNEPLAEGNYKSSVRIKQGKAAQLSEFLAYQTKDDPRELGSSAQRGPLIVLQKNYKDIMAGIDEKIERETKRLDLWETREKARFARLDTLLGNYQNLSKSTASTLATLSSEY